MGSYRDRHWSRRRILGAAGVAGAGAASIALVGCGDDDSKGGSSLSALATPTAAATAVAKVDPFAGATPGGTYKIAITGDPPTVDPFGNLSFQTKTMSAYVYSRLFKYKTAIDLPRADVTPVPDLAASAERSPDGLKWTVKLKPGIKFHNVAPVNGRVVNSDDVKYSWGRLTDPKNAARSQVDYIDKVDFPDPSTIVFSLKSPNAAFLDSISDTNLLFIMPVEADGKFDATKTMIGSGPWLFDSYTPSVNYKMKKNPDWYEKGFPLMDAVEVSIIPEYATRLAQLLAGNLDSEAPNATDLIDVQKVKDIQISSYANQGLNFLFFDGNDPNVNYIKDERIRQAISMACNRDELNDLAYNSKKLKAAGLKVNETWGNIVGSGWGRWWLDPKSAAHGESGKFWKYDPAEAKKLLSAAGFTESNPFSITYQYPGNIYGKNFNDSAEATLGYINQLGNAKVVSEVQDYSSKYITQTFLGNFKGMAFALQTGFGEVGNFAIRMFTDNSFNHGKVKDPVLNKWALDQRAEQDDAKRVSMWHEAQKYQGQKMYYVPLQIGGGGEVWVAAQGAMRNTGGFFSLGYGTPTERTPYLWKKKA